MVGIWLVVQGKGALDYVVIYELCCKGFAISPCSAPSHADDSVEERKLRSSVSRKVRLWNEGEEEEGEVEEEEKEEGEEEEEGGGMMSGEVQLREMIKTERDQKVVYMRWSLDCLISG